MTAASDCVTLRAMSTPATELLHPVNGMVLRESVRFAPGAYVLPDGISVAADAVTIDGNGALLVGRDSAGVGVQLEGRRGVEIKHLRVRDYRHGIRAARCESLTLRHLEVRSTAEVPANTVFLDIWKTAADPYGAAILLHDVADSTIEDNDLQHQMNGLLTYDCRRLAVRRNLANYCSGFGFHFYAASHCTLEDNFADYCCRCEPRGPRAGHVGADAAGFLIVHGSCHNVLRRNFARLGGDGFFLAGLSPAFEHAGCDFNLFEENDGSLSPNIAFEATFSQGNVFRNNRADYCNFGFWLGYSRDTHVEDNRVLMNRQAGIACEHGRGMVVRRNQFHGNGHGILLWTHRHEQFQAAFPDQAVSRDWLIEHNTFVRNTVGLRIAADEEHGLRKADPPSSPERRLRPVDHVLQHNQFQDNRIAIELSNCDRTRIVDNTFSGNVEANIRESDCRDTISKPNLGLGGAYVC